MYTTTSFLEEEEEMGNNLEHASRTQGKPHAGRGQPISVSTLFLSNLNCKFFRKRAIMSSLHSTGHMWAPQVASAASQTHRGVAETWWDGQGLQPLGTLHSWWHRGGRVPRICSHVQPAKHLLQELLLAWAAQPSLHWCSRWYWEPDKENNLSNLLISMTLEQPTGSKVSEEQGQRYTAHYRQ